MESPILAQHAAANASGGVSAPCPECGDAVERARWDQHMLIKHGITNTQSQGVKMHTSRDWLAKGTRILDRDGKISGTLTGAQYACQLEGCTGVRVGVKWDDGKNTRPCSKGLDYSRPDGTLQLR